MLNWTKAKAAFFVSVTAALAVAYFAFLFRFYVNVIYWDEWHNISLFVKLFTGGLGISDLTAFYYGHRPVLPRLIVLLQGSFSGYSILPELLIGAGFLFGATAVMYRIFRSACGGSPLLFLPVAVLMLSLRQWENITLGICSVAWYPLLFFSVSSAYSLYRSKGTDRSFFLGLIFSALATLTLANGLICWITGAFQLLFKNDKRPLGIWAASFVLLIVPYFFDAFRYGSDFLYTGKPLATARFLLAMIGGLFVQPELAVTAGVGIALGTFSLAILELSRKGKPDERTVMFISLAFISFFGSALVTLTRSGYGLDYALSSRFYAFTVLGPASLYLMVLSVPAGTVKRGLISLLILMIISSYVFAIPVSVARAESLARFKMMSKEIMLYPDRFGDKALKDVFSDTAKARTLMILMKKYGLNVFR